MDSFPVSPIEDLNAAIQSYNPFDKPLIVKDQDVWGKGFPDVSTLNAHASEAVFQAIERVRTSQSSKDKVTSLVFTAEQGVGKSHIISRIRHRLEHEGGALFVYANADNYGDLSLIKYEFQRTLAESLKHTGSQTVMQWQEVAAAMSNEAYQASTSPENLVKNFDPASEKLEKRRRSLINELVAKVLRTKPHADPDVIRAILWTLSETRAPYAIKWLSGQELAQEQAEKLGLPNPSKTNQDREADALNLIRQILNLVSSYNPVLICFDELESTKCNDAGFTTPQVIADLVKSLFDTLHQSDTSRGVVILTVMMPDVWTQQIKLFRGGVLDRFLVTGKPIDLKHMDGDSIVDLVTLWLNEFYESRNLKSHDTVYPFEENKLRELGKEKPTVRQVLKWCAENFKVHEEPLDPDPLKRFEFALEKETEANLGDYLEDNKLLGEALCFGFKTLIGQTVEGVTIEKVTDKVKPIAQNNGFINFKLIGSENGKAVKIGVAVLQYSHHISLAAGLNRLIDYEKFDLTRGCLVRSKSEDKKISSNAHSYKLLERLTSELGGEFVELIEEQIRPLIDIHSVYQKRERYKLSEEQIFDFIFHKQLTFNNPLLGEILSAPSGLLEGVAEDDPLKDLFDPTPDDAVEENIPDDDMNDLFN